jgi:MYXO-CTERM domain-containing protein
MTPTKKVATAAAAFASLMTFSAVSFAHVDLSAPTPRAHGQSEGNLKSGPCGQTTNARTTNVTVFAPGETITVEWNEYIDHGFVQRPGNVTDQNADDPEAAEAALNMDAEILAIVTEENDTTAGMSTDVRSTTVTLPNIECENCTLQLIQYMYDNPATGYFQCADIALRAGQQVEPADAGAAGSSSGGTGGAGGAGGFANAGGAGAPGAGGSGGPIAPPPSNPPSQGGAAPVPSTGVAGAASSAGASNLPPTGSLANEPDGEEEGGCSMPSHVGAGAATPGLIGALALALGLLGRRRRAAQR